MTLLATYECNRCGSVFTLNNGAFPHRIQKFEVTKTPTASKGLLYLVNYASTPSDPLTNYDLCEDCNASFNFFMENVKEFDRLADVISGKESSK